jgi:hypothetical protein
MKRIFVACLALGLLLFTNATVAPAQDAEVIKLPPPDKEGGKPLMQALNLRKSTRGNFGPEEKLSMQTLSNLLWAANGINRPDGHTTAPSAVDWKNVDIYAATADGLFLFDAAEHALKVISKQDVRAISGLEGQSSSKMKQDFAITAPLSLVYVIDMAKTKGFNYDGEDVGLTWSAVGVGAIAQNVYLYCASEGLACIVRAMFDAEKVAEVFKLGPDQRAFLTSTIAQFK